MNSKKLIDRLSGWDRKHTDYLIALYNENSDKADFIDDIINVYLQYNELDHSTTWLIKHHVDEGNRLNESQTNKVLSKINELEYWESLLHLLQLIPTMHLTPKDAKSIEHRILLLMDSEKKFVKAAAYDAYFEIVKIFPQLKNEFYKRCELAIQTESASIRSKVKKLVMKMS
uniref:hypothetical protein n=1 Tax=Fulvivirga sp. TaxID=1931237 RepID=UPI00404B1471